MIQPIRYRRDMADADWIGTPQHPHARDLSRFLVHLTRSKEDLESILRTGVIEARTAHGLALHTAPEVESQKAVSFTETPIPDLARMAVRGRQYGIVFSKERLRQFQRALPVWYVTSGSTPHSSLRAVMAASGSPTDPVWNLTPFVDLVTTTQGVPHDFRWEREWRVVGDFDFAADHIAALVVPRQTGELEPITGAVGNMLYVTATGDFYWVGEESEVFEDALEILIDKFHSQFIPANDAGLPFDNEAENGLFPVVDILHTSDAAYETFEGLPEALVQAVVDQVEGEYGDLWCRQYDVDHAHE